MNEIASYSAFLASLSGAALDAEIRGWEGAKLVCAWSATCLELARKEWANRMAR